MLRMQIVVWLRSGGFDGCALCKGDGRTVDQQNEAVVVEEARYGYFLFLLVGLLKWLAGSDVSGGGLEENA